MIPLHYIATGPARGIGPASAAATAFDQFNSQRRSKTLVEAHLERLAKGEVKTGIVAAPSKTIQAAKATSSSATSSSSSSDEEAIKSHAHKKKKRKREKGDKKAKSSKKHKKDKDSKRRKDKPSSSAGAKPASESATQQAWAADHPWRPFDRDKDLDLKPKASKPDQLISQAATMMAGRFKSAGGTRTFL